MNDQERITNSAIRALGVLNARHKSFLAYVSSEANLSLLGGTVIVEDDKLKVTTLNLLSVASSRAIVIGGDLPNAMEYTFTTPFEDGEIPVWRLYLEQSGTLYEDVSFAEHFGDYNGTYVRQNIVVTLANKLLKSRIFAPRV